MQPERHLRMTLKLSFRLSLQWDVAGFDSEHKIRAIPPEVIFTDILWIDSQSRDAGNLGLGCCWPMFFRAATYNWPSRNFSRFSPTQSQARPTSPTPPTRWVPRARVPPQRRVATATSAMTSWRPRKLARVRSSSRRDARTFPAWRVGVRAYPGCIRTRPRITDAEELPPSNPPFRCCELHDSESQSEKCNYVVVEKLSPDRDTFDVPIVYAYPRQRIADVLCSFLLSNLHHSHLPAFFSRKSAPRKTLIDHRVVRHGSPPPAPSPPANQRPSPATNTATHLNNKENQQFLKVSGLFFCPGKTCLPCLWTWTRSWWDLYAEESWTCNMVDLRAWFTLLKTRSRPPQLFVTLRNNCRHRNAAQQLSSWSEYACMLLETKAWRFLAQPYHFLLHQLCC